MTLRNLMLVFITILFIAEEASAKDGLDSEVATIRGSMDKGLIRNVIKRHIHDVRQCYAGELAKNQNLSGRLTVNFTIGKDGKVTESKVEATTLGNPTVEKCIVDAVRGWEFPKPKGGRVVVTYPFVLVAAEPEGDKAGAPHK